MSRHTVPRYRNYGFLVVGYDRPLDNYFCQVWSRGGNMLSSFVCRGIDELREIIKHSKGIVFEPLFRQITKESLGQADTNTCHDWRKEPQGPKESA